MSFLFIGYEIRTVWVYQFGYGCPFLKGHQRWWFCREINRHTHLMVLTRASHQMSRALALCQVVAGMATEIHGQVTAKMEECAMDSRHEKLCLHPCVPRIPAWLLELRETIP